MKKLIRSLVIALGGLFITATASNAASISFIPTGEQLDSDPILDIEAAPGQLIDFQVLLDTNNINTNPPLPFSVEIDFSITLDPTELQLVSLPQETTAIPNGFSFKKDAIPQNTDRTLTTFQVRVLSGLINDGMSDVSLKLNFAKIGNGANQQNVSNSFENGGKQAVEVQPGCSPSPLRAISNGELSGACPVPEPTTILGSVLALGFGATLKPKLKPSKSRKKETEKFS